MTLRFGTDGVRGHEDEFSDEFVVALGRAAARVLGDAAEPFVVGRDPRRSGPGIERALVTGLEAEGLTVELLDVAPTPAVAWVAADRGLAAAMISASHNPAQDNGIKFFAAGGRKLSDAVEQQLEAEIDALLAAGPGPSDPGSAGPGDTSSTSTSPTSTSPTSTRPTSIGWATGELDRYAQAMVGSLEGRRLDGLTVVLDCANGASSALAGDLFARLGARVHVLNASPDGDNINRECGSTHPAALAQAVVERGADVGLAFDGDADRVLAVDETGALVDGDHIIAMCAIDRHERGQLVDDTVVVTVMTNLGFHLAMRARDITVLQTAVGDRYVLEALEAGGYSLGGEQSGHVIFWGLATTGDGMLTGVHLLDLMARSGRSLSALAADSMTRLPQVLHNVRLATRQPGIVDQLAADIAAASATLGETGRVLVRSSGTEPLVRVMVEAPDQDQASGIAADLVAAVGRLTQTVPSGRA